MEIANRQKRFLREIDAGVQGLLKSGKTVDDIQKMGSGKALEAALRFSPEAKNRVGDGLAGQAVVVAEEIYQKKPHGEILGGLPAERNLRLGSPDCTRQQILRLVPRLDVLCTSV